MTDNGEFEFRGMVAALIIVIALAALLLSGCERFDPLKFNEEQVKIKKLCDANDMTTEVSIGGSLLCRPKRPAKPEEQR